MLGRLPRVRKGPAGAAARARRSAIALSEEVTQGQVPQVPGQPQQPSQPQPSGPDLMQTIEDIAPLPGPAE